MTTDPTNEQPLVSRADCMVGDIYRLHGELRDVYQHALGLLRTLPDAEPTAEQAHGRIVAEEAVRLARDALRNAVEVLTRIAGPVESRVLGIFGDTTVMSREDTKRWTEQQSATAQEMHAEDLRSLEQRLASTGSALYEAQRTIAENEEELAQARATIASLRLDALGAARTQAEREPDARERLERCSLELFRIAEELKGES